jgi:PAS domain S-box-containing protein
MADAAQTRTAETQLFHDVFNASPIGIAVENLEGQPLFVNPAFCSFLDFSQEELRNKHCVDFSPREDAEKDWTLFQQLRAGVIDHYQLEKRYFRRDGSLVWGSLSISLLKSSPSPLVLAMVEDITDKKRAEEALFRHAAVIESSSDAIASGTLDGIIVSWNKGAQKIYGYTEAEAVGKPINMLVPPEIPDEENKILEILRAGGRIQHFETVRVTKTGKRINVSLTISPIMDSSGRIVGCSGIARDISERKRAEEILRESEARERAKVKELEAILEAVPVPVLIAYDKECRQMKGNRAAQEQLHVGANQNFSQSAGPDERPAFRQIQDGMEIPADLLPMQQAAATGKPVYGRLMTAVFPDGTKREELANAVPLLNEEGRTRGAIGTSIDLTELRQTEKALRESEDKLRLILDSTAEAIYGIDLEHRCTFCNPACLRTLGYERLDEVLGKNMHDLIHHTRADGTPFPAEECRVHRVTRTGEGVHVEDEVLWRANGTSFQAEYWSYPQRSEQEVVGAVVAFVDITERKLADAALATVSRKLIEAQEQERSRIGRELHDDIGQRLAMVAVQLQQVHEDSVVLPEVRNRVGELKKEISGIADDIQSLSHELHSAKLQYLGLAAAMRGFCKEFGEQQRVEIDFNAYDLPSPLSSEISLCLFRVLQEAVHNSAKHSGVKHFEVRLWGTSEEIHLSVKDSGAGFYREAAKESRGLGLISMEERLKVLNGTLSIESQPQRGTMIHARVPFDSSSDSARAAG